MTLSPLLEQVKSHVCEHFQLGEDKVDSMLPVFLSTLQNHMGNLEKSVHGNSLESIAKMGHAIKGALLNLGLAEMADIAKKIEEEGKADNNEADYVGMVGQLREHLKEIL